MKTAEEWIDDGKAPITSWTEWVRAIQLDAFKAGMTKAAEMVRDHNAKATNIIRARDNLTELP